MKKSLLAVAALGAFATAAHAQSSSVTLYGIIDEGITYNSNAGGNRQFALAGGIMQGSRWGLRGTEDLGGGLKAIFALENGFDPSTGKFGQGGLMFGRQAYVGLSHVQYGTVTLGRQYDSVVDYVGQLAVSTQWGGTYSSHPGDLDNLNNTFRGNNTIKYTSANYAGLTFGATYSLGGIAGQFNQNQIWSAGVGYKNGPLVFGAGYLNARNPNSGFFTNTPAASNASSALSSPVISGYNSARNYQDIAAGAAYTFGAATAGLTYTNTKFKDIGQSSGTNPLGLSGTATFNSIEANFKYQLTPALVGGIAYDYTKGSSVAGQSGAKYHTFSLGADYFLSKRTDVYIMGQYMKASGTDSTGESAVAALNNLTASSNNHQGAVRVGIRHKF